MNTVEEKARKMDVRIVTIDDLEMHRSMLKGTLSSLAARRPEYEFQIVAEFENGQQFLDNIDSVDCDVITMDIRMPVMDGLTTLLHLRRRLNKQTPVCMVSSEDESNIDRFISETISDKVKQMPYEQKLGHMAKVEDRVLAGITEPGKVNDLLNGCEKLMVNPQDYAKHIGAQGFLLKPYSLDQMEEVVIPVLNGKVVV